MSTRILITGASRGIGKAIALRFAKEKLELIITCREQQTLLEEVKEACLSLGSSCVSFVGDIGDFEKVQELYQLIQHTGGNIDVLINNAGISYIGLLSDMSSEEWNHLISNNLSSVFYCSKLAIPSMVAKKQGRILNISSVWGNIGASCEVAYSASKGGVNGFTKALAKELAPSNIQVNAIACGAISTQMNACFTEEELQGLIDEIPANRLGKPEEVADLAFQIICSPTYLTGQIITLDGGWL